MEVDAEHVRTRIEERHPGLKLNIPAWVFCMGWCNLTLSSGGHRRSRPHWSISGRK